MKLIILFLFLLNDIFASGIKIEFNTVDKKPNSNYKKIKISNGQEVFYGLVKYDKSKLFNTYIADGKVIGNLPFKSLVYIYDESKDKYLIGEEIPYGKEDNEIKFYGWIKKNKLLLNNLPIKDKETLIAKKVVLRNNYKTSSDIKKRVNFYKSNTDTSDIASDSKIFRPYFVYDIQNNYYLVGDSDSWTETTIKENEKSKYITGWVHKDNVFEWNTRVSLEFNKDNFSKRELGSIFQTKEDAINYKKNGEKKNIYASEEKTSAELPFYTARMPILDEYSEKIKGKKEKIYKVGFQAKKNNKYDIAKIDQDFQELRLQVENLEILLVIDATGSMRPYIEAVKKAIENFINEITTKNKISFSVAIFRDYEDKEAFNIKTFGNTIEEILKYLKNIDSSGGGDDAEAIYYGLINAINQAKWQKDRSTRVLFLVTDSYDNEKKSEYSQSIFRKTMRENKIDFFAMKINADYSNSEANRQFGRETTLGNYISKYYLINDPNEMFNKVLDDLLNANIFRKNRKDSIDIFKDASSIYEGLEKVEEEYGVIIRQRLEDDIKDILGKDKVNELLDNVAVSEEGYVNESDFKSNKIINKKIYISRQTLANLISTYSNFINRVDNKSTEEKVMNLLISAVNSVIGEDKKFEKDKYSKLSEFLENVFGGIPINSKYLNMGLETLTGELKTTTSRMEFLKDMREKLEYLYSVQGEYEIKEISFKNNKPIVKKGRRINWFFYNSLNEQYVYIPENYFP